MIIKFSKSDTPQCQVGKLCLQGIKKGDKEAVPQQLSPSESQLRESCAVERPIRVFS